MNYQCSLTARWRTLLATDNDEFHPSKACSYLLHTLNFSQIHLLIFFFLKIRAKLSQNKKNQVDRIRSFYAWFTLFFLLNFIAPDEVHSMEFTVLNEKKYDYLLTSEGVGKSGDASIGGEGWTQIFASGAMKQGDEDRLFVLLYRIRSQAPESDIVMLLDSSGGSFEVGLKILEMIRSFGNITTIVLRDVECLSACSIVFMGGNRKSEANVLPSRAIEKGAKIGFHAPNPHRDTTLIPAPFSSEQSLELRYHEIPSIRKDLLYLPSLLYLDTYFSGLLPPYEGNLFYVIHENNAHLFDVDIVERRRGAEGEQVDE